MTEEEKTNLRRKSDNSIRAESERNADSIEAIRNELRSITRDINNLRIENERLAQSVADKAVTEVLAQFGLTRGDEKSIEEFRANTRFAGLMHQLFRNGLMTSVGFMFTFLLGFALFKMGLTPK